MPNFSPRTRRAPRRRRGATPSTLTKVASAILFLLCGLSLWQAAPARQKPDVFSTAQAAVAPLANRGAPSQPTAPHVAQRTLVTRAIEDLRPGMRVIAENPELAGQDVPETQFNPAETRLVRLRMQKPDGGTLDIETLRTTDQLGGWAWERLASAEALTGHVAALPPALPWVGTEEEIFLAETLLGHTVDLDLPELGAAGPSRILAIEPCPELEPDDGTGRRLITSTFRHSAANLLDVQIGEDHSPIGVTSNHPFWSADRQAFVPAGELREGEWLRRADQTLTQVTRINPRTGPPVPVFNVEVDGQHVYHIGPHGLTVHNVCAGYHHFLPAALGNLLPYGPKYLKHLSETDHTALHKALNQFLKSHSLGDMYARKGNTGRDIRAAVPKLARIRAVSQFYRTYQGGIYFQDFVTEMRKAWKLGAID